MYGESDLYNSPVNPNTPFASAYQDAMIMGADEEDIDLDELLADDDEYSGLFKKLRKKIKMKRRAKVKGKIEKFIQKGDYAKAHKYAKRLSKVDSKIEKIADKLGEEWTASAADEAWLDFADSANSLEDQQALLNSLGQAPAVGPAGGGYGPPSGAVQYINAAGEAIPITQKRSGWESSHEMNMDSDLDGIPDFQDDQPYVAYQAPAGAGYSDEYYTQQGWGPTPAPSSAPSDRKRGGPLGRLRDRGHDRRAAQRGTSTADRSQKSVPFSKLGGKVKQTFTRKPQGQRKTPLKNLAAGAKPPLSSAGRKIKSAFTRKPVGQRKTPIRNAGQGVKSAMARKPAGQRKQPMKGAGQKIKSAFSRKKSRMGELEDAIYAGVSEGLDRQDLFGNDPTIGADAFTSLAGGDHTSRRDLFGREPTIGSGAFTQLADKKETPRSDLFEQIASVTAFEFDIPDLDSPAYEREHDEPVVHRQSKASYGWEY